MTPFWIKFEGRSSACVEADNKESALAIAAEHGKPIAGDVIPYPATPRLGEQSKCPPFCYSPESCKGRSSCPQNYACSE